MKETCSIFLEVCESTWTRNFQYICILIQTTNMDVSGFSIQLGLLSETEITMLLEEQPICCCQFFDESVSPANTGSEDLVVLELRGDYVVQVDPKNLALVCGFKCNYEINFEIGRTTPNTPNSVGMPRTISFLLHSGQQKPITLIAKNAYQLDNFSRKLEKKYIVQRGFHESFKAVKILGKGLTATVYKAISFRDQKDVAIKSFKRAVYFETNHGKESFQKEFKILTAVEHANICALDSVYESPNTTYIVMENLALSLFGWIQKYGFPSLEEGKKILWQLLIGIEYLHSKKIMHRDLKLENIMVRKDVKQNVEIVIVDLGLAEYTYSPTFLYTRCGTPGYVAPEILKHKPDSQKYNEACDVFSLGAIFFIITFKKSLFEGSDVKEVIRKNTQCAINFSASYLESLPSQGLDLLKRMLEKDPAARITASQALKHSYFCFSMPQNTSFNGPDYVIEPTKNLV